MRPSASLGQATGRAVRKNEDHCDFGALLLSVWRVRRLVELS